MKSPQKRGRSAPPEFTPTSAEEAFKALEARADVRALFEKIQKSTSFTREAAEAAFAHVDPKKK